MPKVKARLQLTFEKIERHADYSGLRFVEIMANSDTMSTDNESVKEHNRENTPKDIHCRMNHRFLGKCRRGSARSPASM